MHIDLKLIQRLFIVTVIRAKAGEHNSAHRVNNDFVGVGSEKVLLLREIVANRDNRLAAFLKALQGAADFFQFGDAATGQIVGVEQNMGDTLVVLGMVENIDYISDQGFGIPLIGLRECLGKGINIGSLVNQYPARC